MAISEMQLDTWSHQGSIIQSRTTYATVKAALEDPKASHARRKPKVFLQGSYSNDTNIYAETDVDVVIVYEGAFFKDLSELPSEQVAAYNAHYSANDYSYEAFKTEVQTHLENAFPKSVKPDVKAIKIPANGARRSSDVIVAFRYRRYFRFRTVLNERFQSVLDENFEPGICFKRPDGTLIANYPEQHSTNCTTKHQNTGNNFKPLVRIFKNMRSKLERDGVLKPGDAPSYFIEGLLYNAPTDSFSGSYSQIVLNLLNWMYNKPDRTKFVCANEQYYLLRDNDPVCWPTANGAKFVTAVIRLWNDWK